MSPALFLLCMEFFLRMIKRKISNSKFNFHPKCEKLKITHLLFADDLMLFSRGELPSIHILMECLQEFRNIFGLVVNTSKSSIFTTGIVDNELVGILARTEFTRGEMPVRYLGIPLAAQRLLITDYSPLVDPAVVDKIHRLCRNFLWNSKRAPVAWKEVCHPKKEGGLGIRHIQSWNVALLTRVLWNIHCKADTLWVKWVNEVYLRSALVWDWQPKNGDSLLIRRLADIRDKIIMAFGISEAAVQYMADWSNAKGLETSKAYEYFRPKLIRQLWKAAIWKAFIPSKYSFILWLGLRGRLAARDRLAFLQEEHSCSFCINTIESASHLFFACPFSAHVWTDIRQWLDISRRMSTLPSAVKWLKKEKTGSFVQNKVRAITSACTIYSLWRHRNEVIFEGKAPNSEALVICIKITVYRLILALFPHGF
ncbi:UNVERIFIED_CONTAM: hypothetical protein Slati_3786400 [Sesamum latifolium]|uniref:Reverse transcriptase domain-containing protein n=1 Tax=Sesamum latifolium TaxID=2727402 RepID=A0AAW2U5N6_9LAMI